MSNCMKCEQPIANGIKFCPHCGAAANICSKCLLPLPNKVKFCPQCGTAVVTLASGAMAGSGHEVLPSMDKPAASTREQRSPVNSLQAQRIVDKRTSPPLSTLALISFVIVGIVFFFSYISTAHKDTTDASVGTSSTSTATTQINKDTYTAYLTCGRQGFENINILACFTNHGLQTSLELNNGNAYRMYKVFDLQSAGYNTEKGLAIHLQHNFTLQAQNASNLLLLGVRIYNNRTNQQVFVKQADEFGVIMVSSDELSN